MVMDGGQNVIFFDGYQPFGQDNGTPKGSETYKYTGKPWSNSINLYYSYQRWYDPSTGRFISADPIPGDLSSPQSLNDYIYTSDLPTTLTDPTGLVQLATERVLPPCPSFFSDPWGNFTCTSSRTPVGIVGDFGAAVDLAGAGWSYLASQGPRIGAIALSIALPVVVGIASYEGWIRPVSLSDENSNVRDPNLRNVRGTERVIGLPRSGSWADGSRPMAEAVGFGDIGAGNNFPIGSGGRWSAGFSNGYIRNLKKAISDPSVVAACNVIAASVALGLWFYESEESARLNIKNPSPATYFALYGSGVSLCYGVAAVGYGVMGSF